jgi:3-hydroxyisobutyrate dehydrogenase
MHHAQPRREGEPRALGRDRRMADSAASSALIRHDLNALLDGDCLASFELDRCCEELASVTGLAREYETPCELSAVVERTCRRALSRYGPVAGELLAVALLEEQAGARLRHSQPD